MRWGGADEKGLKNVVCLGRRGRRVKEVKREVTDHPRRSTRGEVKRVRVGWDLDIMARNPVGHRSAELLDRRPVEAQMVAVRVRTPSEVPGSSHSVLPVLPESRPKLLATDRALGSYYVEARVWPSPLDRRSTVAVDLRGCRSNSDCCLLVMGPGDQCGHSRMDRSHR